MGQKIVNTAEQAAAAAVQPEIIPKEYEERLLEAFVQKPEKLEWYKRAFSRFTVNGVDKMAWVWSWWAFFGTFWFLLYRKAYMAAFVVFIVQSIISYIPLLGLIFWILTGGCSTYFIYKGYKQKKDEIETKIEDPKIRIETMEEVGGFNQWVVWLYTIFAIVVTAGILITIISVINARQ